MRKIVVIEMISVDGYFAGTDGNIDWHNVDNEFNQFAIEQLKTFDAALFGKTTYQMFADYWPKALKDPKTDEDDRVIAQLIDELQRICISEDELTTNWQPSEIWYDLTPEKVKTLKASEGKNIVVYGSGTVVDQLTEMGLVDDYKFMVAPVMLGQGKPLLSKPQLHKLQLVEARPFTSGNVLLHYKPAA